MKKSKILAPALAILCLGVAASVSGTVAWFSANNIVRANGMHFRSTTPSYIVIGKSLVTDEEPRGIGDAIEIDFEETADTNENILNPCSSYHGDPEVIGEAPDTVPAQSGELYYVTNSIDVDKETGLGIIDPVGEGETATPRVLHYSEALTAPGHYYKDYKIYIGAYQEGLTLDQEGQKLSVEATFTTTEGSQKAATVNFYSKYVTSPDDEIANLADFKGSINAIKKKAIALHDPATFPEEGVDTAEACTSVDILSGKVATATEESPTIPAHNSGNAILVVARVYLDGSLLSDATHTYARNNNLNIGDIGVSFAFSLTM